MKIRLDELREEISYLFNPEPDDEGFMPQEFPHPKLKESTELDFSFLEIFEWEGSSCHEHTRYCPEDEEKVHTLTRNKDVPGKLFEAALHIFADSIIAYYTSENRTGQIRFYPSIILTFWSGFETYIRHTSELMIATAKDIPIQMSRC